VTGTVIPGRAPAREPGIRAAGARGKWLWIPGSRKSAPRN